jgi:hypothetical protein
MYDAICGATISQATTPVIGPPLGRRGRISRMKRVQSKVVKTASGVRDRSINRRADSDPAQLDPKIHPRTFHIDPGERLLVAEHNLPVNAGWGYGEDSAGLSVFRIGDGGKLTFVRKYDIDVGDKTMFWMGMVPP